MRWTVRYAGTPFTQAQVDEIGRALRLDGHDAALKIARKITVDLSFCEHMDRARREVPDTKLARRRLESISKLAGQLSKLIESDPIVEKRFKGPDFWGIFEDRDIRNDVSEEKQCRIELQSYRVEVLREIQKESEEILADDEVFRHHYGFPPTEQAGRTTLAWLLWPRLFDLWQRSGRPPALTAKGPLHRFVSLVHKAVGAPEPSASTLKDAVLKWRQDGRSAGSADDPP